MSRPCAQAPGRGPRVLADIGGTHARFAWQAGPADSVTDFVTLECARFACIKDALRTALRGWRREAPPDCGIAIATPVFGDRIRMTNLGWEFSVAQLRDEFGFNRLEVLNDFSALALAVPAIEPRDLRALGGGPAMPQAPMAVMGPGTGLGVSALVPDGTGGWRVLESEGGHASLPACTATEREVLARLAAQHGHVSAERVLSGPGLVNLHRTLWAMSHPRSAAPQLGASVIARAAVRDADPVCVEALKLFCAFLGSVAGNLALTLGARGGVYLGGGIVPRLGGFIERAAFRERFESKGRLSGYLASIPVWAIHTRESPALQGVATALDADPTALTHVR